LTKLVIQKHHIIYENIEHHQKEVVVPIFKGEHWISTNLNRRKNISKGFIKYIKVWIVLNEEKAIDLESIPEQLNLKYPDSHTTKPPF
jgi:hypothetical protein